MKPRDTRLWALLIAIAFLTLWCVSVGVTCTAPVQEPLPEPIQAPPSLETQIIGILGWCIVGLGFLGVALAVAFSGKPKKRRKLVRLSGSPRRPYKVAKSIYSPPPPRRYRQNIERRR